MPNCHWCSTEYQEVDESEERYRCVRCLRFANPTEDEVLAANADHLTDINIYTVYDKDNNELGKIACYENEALFIAQRQFGRESFELIPNEMVIREVMQTPMGSSHEEAERLHNLSPIDIDGRQFNIKVINERMCTCCYSKYDRAIDNWAIYVCALPHCDYRADDSHDRIHNAIRRGCNSNIRYARSRDEKIIIQKSTMRIFLPFGWYGDDQVVIDDIRRAYQSISDGYKKTDPDFTNDVEASDTIVNNVILMRENSRNRRANDRLRNTNSLYRSSIALVSERYNYDALLKISYEDWDVDVESTINDIESIDGVSIEEFDRVYKLLTINLPRIYIHDNNKIYDFGIMRIDFYDADISISGSHHGQGFHPHPNISNDKPVNPDVIIAINELLYRLKYGDAILLIINYLRSYDREWSRVTLDRWDHYVVEEAA